MKGRTAPASAFATVVARVGPALAVTATLALTLLLLAPILQVASLGPGVRQVEWMDASPDLFTRNQKQGEVMRPLTRPQGASRVGPRQYVHFLDRSVVPAGPLALYVPISGGELRTFFNRVPLHDQIMTPVPSPFHLSRAGLAPVPRTLLHPGLNRVDLVVSGAQPLTWPRALYLGPQQRLEAALERQTMISGWLPGLVVAVGGIGFFITLLLAVMVKRLRGLWLPAVLVAMATGLCSLPFGAPTGDAEPFARLVSDVTLPALAVGLGPAIKRRGYASTGARPVLFLGGLAGLFVLVALHSIPLFWPAISYGPAHTVSLTMVFGALANAIWLQRDRGQLAQSQSLLAPSIAWLAISAVLAAGISRLDVPGFQAQLVAETFASVASFLVLAAWLGAMSGAVVSQVGTLWRRRHSLAMTVRDQEEKLAAQAEIIGRESRRRAVLEERERMMLDIHDGIGGQLLSLLIRVRGDRISRDEIEQELEGGLNDLRLIIDSLDQSDTSLSVGLATLRTRLSPQMEAADIRMEWRQDDERLPVIGEARVILHIYRIIQEILTNVVKHARAKSVTVVISGSRKPGEVVVTISDSGVGMSAPLAATATGGKGLTNIRRRAEVLGGSLAIGNNPNGPGVQVRLVVPVSS